MTSQNDLRIAATCGAIAAAGLALSAGCKGTAGESERGPAAAAPAAEPRNGEDLAARAEALTQKLLIADGHIDLPYRLHGGRDDDGEIAENVAKRTEGGDFDYPRAIAGGLDAPFMSIYVPASFQEEGGAKAEADAVIDIVEGLIAEHPDRFAAATSPDEILANTEDGLISLPMGIENGAALEGELDNLEHFYDRGIRYITLTHAEDNAICDSSYAETQTWGGLSEFGEQVVREMNRLGILVDISHLTDEAAQQAMRLSDVPVIASHSSLRHFIPGFERNMSDEMVRELGERGGVIMINFGSTFVSEQAREYFDALEEAREAAGHERDTDAGRAFAEAYKRDNPPVYATVDDVADHIDRAVELAGIDHVGLGSDFDGVGDTLPTGLKDPSDLPNLFRVLLERGYSESDLEKLASGNLLRVWRQAIARAEAAEETGGDASASP